MATKKNEIGDLFQSKKAVVLMALLLALLGCGFLWWSYYKDVAVYVNGDTISKTEYQSVLHANRKYRESKGEDFSSDQKLKDLKSDTINSLLKEAVVFQEAISRGLSVSSQDVDNEYKKIVEANTNGDEGKFKDQIAGLYDYTVEEYKEYIVRNSLYKKKLESKVTTEVSYKKEAKDRIDLAKKELDGGADFASVVTKYSDDESSKLDKGSMGQIKRGQTPKEFEDVAFSLERGSVSSVFETVLGFHIIKVTDKKDETVTVSQVLVSVEPFDAWLVARVKASKVKILVS